MSWYINAIGKPGPVAANLRAQITHYRCKEPEEAIKNAAMDLIERALKEFPESFAVKVRAQGSLWEESSDIPGKFPNNLEINIEPLFGFVE